MKHQAWSQEGISPCGSKRKIRATISPRKSRAKSSGCPCGDALLVSSCLWPVLSYWEL
jgi:hypothetical protein